MCVRVSLKDRDITTVRELRKIVSEIVIELPLRDLIEDGCLCQVNLPATLSAAGLEYTKDDFCDYVVDDSKPSMAEYRKQSGD